MIGLRSDSRFARAIAPLLSSEPFRLVDIGWPSGLAPGWNAFGEAFRALVVTSDDSVAEAIRAVSPLAAAVIAPLDRQESYAPTPWPDRLSVDRTRALLAGDDAEVEAWVRQRASGRPAQDVDPDAPPLEGRLGRDLVRRIVAEGFADADLLRVDAWDADLEILSGADDLLGRPELLSVVVRGRLFGSADPRDNSFHNLDRLLRRHGYQPYVIQPLLFSAAALPAPYMDRHPEHTLTGRPATVTAVYLRDPGTPRGELSAASHLKQAATFALFGLPDAAAEVLILNRQALAAAGFEVDAGLDLLALQAQEDWGTRESYRDYIAAFEQDRASFYDVYGAQAKWMEGLVTTTREAPERIRQLEGKARTLVRRLDAAERRTGRPTAETLLADASRRSDIFPAHHWIFDHFEPYRGPATQDFYLDYIGSRIRPEFNFWGPPVVAPVWEPSLPDVDEEYFEWIDILQAVREAGPVFTMLELGAAYGRWSSRAALAARQLGKQVRLGLAEAEPKHQEWLRRHMADNGVGPAEYRTYDFAVGGSVDEVVFTVALPGGVLGDTHFGHGVVPADLRGRKPAGDYYGKPVYDVDGWGAIRVEQQPLSAVLEPYDAIDIVDFDLQGAEAEAIAEALPMLTSKVRRLHIGTHGHDIEATLRDILAKAGWICVRDFPCHGRHETPFGPADFVDGVQSWVNPARF